MKHIQIHNIQQPKQGLTLIELLIASSIGMIILTMTAQMLVSIFRTRAQLQQLNQLQQTSTLVIQDIRDSIRWSTPDGISVPGSNTLNTTAHQYILSGSTLTKDGTPIHPNDVQINSTQLFNIPNDTINNDQSSYLPLIRIQFTINSTLNPSLHLTPDVTFTNKRQKYGP